MADVGGPGVISVIEFECGCTATTVPAASGLVNLRIEPCSEDCWRPVQARAEYDRIMARRSN